MKATKDKFVYMKVDGSLIKVLKDTALGRKIERNEPILQYDIDKYKLSQDLKNINPIQSLKKAIQKLFSKRQKK